MPAKTTQFKFGKNPVMVAPTQGANTLNIYVFGEIHAWWGLNKNEVLRYLKGHTYSQINLVISSHGGDLAEALVIRDLLKAYPAKNVTTFLTGFCASAATIVADAGGKVVMSRQCVYMIHKPLFEWTGGNADDLRKDAAILDVWEKIVLGIYAAKTGLNETELRSLMEVESWLGPEEALALGFVDEVVDTIEIDYELDSTGVQEQTFICEPIDFKQSATIYNQAITNALKGGYKQISPAMMQGIKPLNKENSFNMNQLAKMFVSMLVKAGIITAENENAAIEATSKMEAPEMIAAIVKEEVAKNVKNAVPAMKTGDVVKLIESASDEEKASIAAALGVKNDADTTELEKTVKDLGSKVAKLIVGDGNGSDGNGGDGLGDKKDKKGEPTFAQKQHLKMYTEAYESGHIDSKTYESLTGKKPPKKA
jgi:ATP-dependent protease ClpP protease subunit